MTGLFGYAGATVCGVGTGMLADKFGWNAAFYMYAASAVIGSLLFLFLETSEARTTENCAPL